MGDWLPEQLILAMFPAKGHLERLKAQGKVRAVREALSKGIWIALKNRARFARCGELRRQDGRLCRLRGLRRAGSAGDVP
jgi:hypothetical protein